MSMRIFTAVRHSNDPAQYYGGLWSSNFYPALRELGCEIVESQTDLLFTSRFMGIAGDFTREELAMRAQTTDRILDEVREARRHGPIHLFLSYFYNAHFDPEGFECLRQLGIPSVNFYCNSIHQFEQVAEIAAQVDFSWHPERDARQSYLAVGANPIHVQMGADPQTYFPVSGVDRLARACFVGQRYADRDRWLSALVEANIPIDIYGAGWTSDSEPHVAGVPETSVYLGREQIRPGTFKSYRKLIMTDIRRHGVIGAIRQAARQAAYRSETQRLAQRLHPCVKGKAGDLPSIFGAYEVSVNLSNVWTDGRPGSPLVSHIRLRDFEAPMSRACYLTGHNDEISEFYDLGREVDTYRDKLELADKARFYLVKAGAAERLREAGYRRARHDHTWTRRFEDLLARTGLDAKRP
jgi:spore maturation protein CgeB